MQASARVDSTDVADRARSRDGAGMASAAARNNVRISGRADGQPMVFAHGYGCDQSMWRLVAPRFADRYRVVNYDHTGFGGSDLSAWDPERHSTLHGYAEDLLDILRELDLTDVVFVGHSVAAMIGALAAIEEPERFAELVMVGPSPRYIDDPGDGYLGGFTEADIDELIDTVDSNYLGWSAGMAPVIMGNADRPELAKELTDSFCRVDPKVAKTFVRATFLADNRADLPRLRVPTLVLQSRDDAIASETVGRYVADHVPASEFEILDASGHCPNLSAPDVTYDAIDRHLRAVQAV